jgi:hypothetical protein
MHYPRQDAPDEIGTAMRHGCGSCEKRGNENGFAK